MIKESKCPNITIAPVNLPLEEVRAAWLGTFG